MLTTPCFALCVFQYTEIDEDEDDDWDISSLDDKPSGPKQDSVVMVKKSLDSSNTSIWGSSTGKGQEGQHFLKNCG